MIFGSYLVVEVLVDLCEVVDVGLVDPLLVVQPLSLQVQLGQILKIKIIKGQWPYRAATIGDQSSLHTASKRPPMTSEVNYEVKINLSDPNNPCSSAFLASIVLYWTNLARRRKADYHP